ncbi:tyrosine-type recombinase/integrase [Enterococcus faecalis]|nr:site-specific integrase [Enterococcus faecalis]EOJ74429.1 hypothetical protein WMY_00634 [Enterococcus faecalis EnGen0337]MCO5446629.1 site-specific integrase [Enterococcus faecalis]MDL4972760.1 site-specific integrase [Enterococcus faecalis]
MSITKMASGNFKVDVYYPKDVREFLGLTTARFKKTYSSYEEAILVERELLEKIKQVQKQQNGNIFDRKQGITFENFFKNIYWSMYISGSLRSRKAPKKATIDNAERIFRLHILPLFGSFTLFELNSNKELLVRELNKKSREYANIKALKSYVNNVFDVADFLDYIDNNNVAKIIRYIGEPKKDSLKEKRELLGESLSAKELVVWIQAFQTDFEKGILSLQDYVLFMLTLHLADRKSESYALQWKHVDFNFGGSILLIQSKDAKGNITSTKGNKKTRFHIPEFLLKLLMIWKEKQKEELLKIGIVQTDEQFVFTYKTRKTNKLNVPVHIDYLNHRINAVEKRHPYLVHATPHMFRHTFSTLAYEGGATMEQISQMLTHSDTNITKIYVNTESVVDLSTHEKFEKRLLMENSSLEFVPKQEKNTL